MNWKELIQSEAAYSYRVTENLFELVDEKSLNWKPSTGSNWMTIGQLLKHISNACGSGIHGFVTGDWGMPVDKMKPEDMIPPAERLPAVSSLKEAKALLAADKKIAFDTLAKVSEDKLATQPAPAPWDPTPMVLGQRLLSMVKHLNQHKGQLFYYLKLQGKPVNTGHLWGM